MQIRLPYGHDVVQHGPDLGALPHGHVALGLEGRHAAVALRLHAGVRLQGNLVPGDVALQLAHLPQELVAFVCHLLIDPLRLLDHGLPGRR